MVDNHPVRCPVHGIPDCSVMLNGCNLPNQILAQIRVGIRAERAREDRADTAVREVVTAWTRNPAVAGTIRGRQLLASQWPALEAALVELAAATEVPR